jgi:hypothetical protein
MGATHVLRSGLYREVHGEPVRVFRAGNLEIEAFEVDVSPADDDQDLGYVLFTNGMSDRRMQLDADAATAVADGRVKQRAELAWYVRELDASCIDSLSWLAEFPFVDATWLGWGHTVIMPEPIVPGSELVAFFLLTPILARHRSLFAELRIADDPVELLVVHLLTAEEYALKKREGANAILDLFDENDYPLLLDPARTSYV